MPSLTYLKRVQNILGVLAQDDQSSIVLADFVERVQDSMTLDLIPPRPRMVAHVNKVLKHERLARRIKIVQGADGRERLNFRNYNIVRLFHDDQEALKKLTVRQLRKETKTLNGILRGIREEIRRSHDRYSTLSAFEDIPHIISTVIERIDALNVQNTELTAMLAEERGMEHNILAEYPLYESDN
ncbi:hypothetical protein PYCCODRAFT_1471867 [Trametes coccinea BRFM310]|uniref:Uncharacterized protein n=1 Tax=Trametes coccinea (strain BRFM310) TaxID=1353009 RepID=A0A1Y2IC44_TRAC3|nr:hypothetical protein PYCCODRAFT_1471867 [Trametes coccinea BRFM310]